jgi:hypothetical protein
MPRFRPTIAAGLLVVGLNILTAATSTEAVAANECPCIKSGNSCVPDLACEALLAKDKRGNIAAPRLPPAQPRGEFRARPLPPAAPPVAAAPPPLTSPAPPLQGTAPARNGSAPVVRSAPAASDARPPAAANGRSPASVPTSSERAAPATAPRLRILETGYSHLSEFGKETPGYGLYSYAILPSGSDRTARFLTEVFREIPAIGDTSAKPSQLNIFYVPLRKDKEADFTAMLQTSGRDAAKLGAEYTKSFYDYRMARGLLNHICNPPDPSVLDLCNGDLSRGPYIFAYAAAASHIEPVPPPFLLVDLSDVHERAFGEFLAAFQAQVKREDISDQARIKTLRLRVLNIALTAADWVPGVEKAVADITHIASGGDDKKPPAQ